MPKVAARLVLFPQWPVCLFASLRFANLTVECDMLQTNSMATAVLQRRDETTRHETTQDDTRRHKTRRDETTRQHIPQVLRSEVARSLTPTKTSI